MASVITAHIRKYRKIPDSLSLTEAGYFSDIISPSENFYINNGGIGFIYNPYEVSPFAYGIHNIYIPYDEIYHLIREASPIARLSENN